MPRRASSGVSAFVGVVLASTCAGLIAAKPPLDRTAERWIEQTRTKLTLDEKIGQLIVPSFESAYLSTDSDTFDELSRLVREYHVGGFHVFGASIAAPPVLLNPSYGTVILGQPFSAASLVNRLQGLSPVPLLNTADFEAGVGFRISGGTVFPRQMAMGAIAGDAAARLIREEARITAVEARAIGVHVNFAPLADVNNNPRNPVINTRSYGEDPGRVAILISIGLADRGAEPHVHSGAAQALSAGDGHRIVRPHAAIRPRRRPGAGAALRRDRRGSVRSRQFGERAS
jgi:beta-N-acetylhexosaminidase